MQTLQMFPLASIVSGDRFVGVIHNGDLFDDAFQPVNNGLQPLRNIIRKVYLPALLADRSGDVFDNDNALIKCGGVSLKF
jgi:hypothetical protein